MTFPSPLPTRQCPAGKPPTTPGQRQRPRWRPTLEALEDRLAPSAGDLDLSFSTDGKVTTDIGLGGSVSVDLATAVAVQADEKIVVAGRSRSENASQFDFAVARYNPDGTLDSGFGGGGKTTIDFSGTDDRCTSIAIDASGRIILAGSSVQGAGHDFAVTRLNADGSPDTSFGVAGKVTFDFGDATAFAHGVVLDASGRVVVAGYSLQGTTGFDFAVARLTSSGDLDVTFGGDGRATIDFGGSDEFGHAVALDAGGRIVVAGATREAFGFPDDFAVTRLTSSGDRDLTFGANGRTIIDFGSGDDVAHGVALDAGGRIVAAGVADVGAGRDFAVTRLTSGGNLDTTFGGDGRATIDFGSSEEEGHAVALDAKGRIVVAGVGRVVGDQADFAVARLTSGGNPDATFGGGGRTIIDLGGSDDEGDAVALDAGGRIVVAGNSRQGATFRDFAVARLESNSPPAASAGGPYTVAEGSEKPLSGSGSDPDGDPLTFTWDLDADGVFGETGLAAQRGDEVGTSPTYHAPLGIGGTPVTVDVILRVSDGSLFTDDSATINILPLSIFRWSGGSELGGNWSDAANWQGGVAPQPGGNLVFPASAARFAGTNDFPADSTFGSVTIEAAATTWTATGCCSVKGWTSAAAATPWPCRHNGASIRSARFAPRPAPG